MAFINTLNMHNGVGYIYVFINQDTFIVFQVTITKWFVGIYFKHRVKDESRYDIIKGTTTKADESI